MPRIAVLLVGTGPQDGGDVIDIFLHDVEQAAVAGRHEIGDGAFQHVAGAIEFVVVAQIGPALVDLAPDVPAIAVAVGKLRLGELLGDLIDLRLDLRVAAVKERVACGLDPFADVGVPKDLGSEIVHSPARDRKRRRRLHDIQRFKHVMELELAVLAWDGARQHRVETLAPEGTLDLDLVKPDR